MRHIQTEHERSDRWQCEECEKSFSNKYSLNYHVKACHVRDYISTGPVCAEKFNTVAEYCKHKKSAHRAEVKFECGYCGKHFKTRSNLNRHKQEIHSEETRTNTSKIKVNHYLACDQCSFITKRASLLLSHAKNKQEC